MKEKMLIKDKEGYEGGAGEGKDANEGKKEKLLVKEKRDYEGQGC